MKYWIMTRVFLMYVGITIFGLMGCKHGGESHSHHDHHGQANAHMHSANFDELVERFESEERTAYQRPDTVMQYIGDVDGKKVMDLGAGTGYFSLRLVDAGAHVIAADVDDRFLKYLQNKKEEYGLSDQEIILRKVEYDDPRLKDNEVDIVLMVNTYHHIEDRVSYFGKVLQGMKSGGKLYIIDFKKEELPVGPPMGIKLTAEVVEGELKAAGFSLRSVENDLLPYQYIVTASK